MDWASGAGAALTQWPALLLTYTKSQQIFYCPDASSIYTYDFDITHFCCTGPYTYGGAYAQYAMNCNYLATSDKAALSPCSWYQDYGAPVDQTVVDAKIAAPSTTVYVTDGISNLYWTSPTVQWGYGVLNSVNAGTVPGYNGTDQANYKVLTDETAAAAAAGGLGSGSVIARHTERTNALFVDGHVKSMDLGTLSQTITTPGGHVGGKYFTIADD